MFYDQKIINAFIKLGEFLGQFKESGIVKKPNVFNNDVFFNDMKDVIELAKHSNGWFSEKNILFSLENWSKVLNINNFNTWLLKYNFNISRPKTVAIIMAGNIPLIGFHDFICVLISGHNVLVKQSSNDKILLPFITKYLVAAEPSLKSKIQFTDDKIDHFDAAIATGSNNTSRYFEYYFRNKPSIIRKNRNSVAVLTGNESEAELDALSEDIFSYYGLGCRNVSKLFLPQEYNFDLFFNAIYKWHPIINENKYANNYDYNKAVYLMSDIELLDNGYFILKEDSEYASPIACLFYEKYDSLDSLRLKLEKDEDKIQCIVSNGLFKNEVGFGETQKPQLWDYADGVDTVDFLLKI